MEAVGFREAAEATLFTSLRVAAGRVWAGAAARPSGGEGGARRSARAYEKLSYPFPAAALFLSSDGPKILPSAAKVDGEEQKHIATLPTL